MVLNPEVLICSFSSICYEPIYYIQIFKQPFDIHYIFNLFSKRITELKFFSNSYCEKPLKFWALSVIAANVILTNLQRA